MVGKAELGQVLAEQLMAIEIGVDVVNQPTIAHNAVFAAIRKQRGSIQAGQTILQSDVSHCLADRRGGSQRTDVVILG